MDQALLLRPETFAAEEVACAQRGSADRRPERVRPANLGSASDLPTVSPGECWLLALPATGAEPGVLERRVLTVANVIIYDRALANQLAAILPLGGYAEPAVGDGLERTIRFACSGWSVVKLIEHTFTNRVFADQAHSLAARLQAAGASSNLKVSGFAETGRGLRRAETSLGKFGALIGGTLGCEPQVIVFRAFGCRDTPALRAVMSNGLAG